MQVLSTPVTPAPVNNNKPPVFKPLTERWSVEGQQDSFASTTALVAQGEALDGRQATYRYAQESAPAPFTSGERFANAVGSGLQSAAVGAVGGAMLGGVITLVAGVGDILGGLMGGRMDGVSRATLLVPIALGAGIGAVGGGMSGYQTQAAAPEGTVNGTLKAQNGQVLFYPGGQVDKEVNLSEFQAAPEAPVIETSAVETSRFGNTVKGALTGAAIVPAIMIPLAGLAAGGYVGYRAGSALDKRTELGRGLGLTLGIAATAATIATGQVGGVKSAAVLAGGLGVVGAALGHSVLAAEARTEAHHDYGSQWWNRAAAEQQPR